MTWRTTLCLLGALGCMGLISSPAQAQVVVVGGGPVFGTTVVVGRPVVPVGPVLAHPTYVAPAVGYRGYSTYRPVAPAAFIAPAPVVTYRPVVPAYVPVRPGIVSSRVYYPGQPVRNALRVIAP
ncbi:MAG: hypothetical protein IT423_14410 [Pirellulaceae bacterium]|nr:hypothetical protein [Pirellulaceae bacterium]